MFDLKELDSQRHRELTGVGNDQILENLRLLNELGKRVILRCPIIPDQNMTAGHFEGIGRLAQALSCVEAVELEPYHPLGLSKYKGLDRTPGYNWAEFLAPEELIGYAALMRRFTTKTVRLSNGDCI